MSESGTAQRLTLPGLLSALFVLGGGAGSGDAHAAGLHRALSSMVPAGTVLAQAAPEEELAEPATAEDGEQLDEEVPFSELNEALTAARSRLAELTKAAEIAKVAGEIREKLQAAEAENRQLKSVLSQLQTENSDLHSDRQAMERQLAELEQVAQAAAAEASQLGEELVAIRSENLKLSSDLARTEASSRETTEELTKVRQELSARAESLAAAADVSASEIARLQRELDDERERALVAERAQAEGDTEVAELREITEEATADRARIARDLDSTITELAAARSELATTQQALEDANVALKTADEETGVLRTQLTGNRSEADELRARLKTTEIDLEQVRKINSGLEQQVALLKTAAGEATDAARQNLLAVEDQINEINAALASVKADELLPGAGGPVVEDEGAGDESPAASGPVAPAVAADADGWVPRPSPPRAAIERQLIAAAAPEVVQVTAVRSPLAGTVNPPPAPPRETDIPKATVNLASLTTDLPADRQDDAAALLAELDVERDHRGLSMTVPGELLFAVNSERIEPAAFDALASVAELVDLYGEHDVLIVGHTDAVGDADYNQQLSERRAALVRSYFIDNFQISESRLRIEGKGEQDPITSNATADGRNANRRVEVVILNQ